jgi:hypothetical protein
MLDYRTREFALEDKSFSSFAYLIDATEIFIAALSASNRYQDITQAEVLCGDLEARVISWFLLLPLSKRELPVSPGSMDQLMFQAHMMMYTYAIGRSIGMFIFFANLPKISRLYSQTPIKFKI